MGGHLAFTGGTHAVTLFGLRQNHGRLAAMIGRRLIGRMDFLHVVTAAPQAIDFFVGQRRCNLAGAFVLTKEMLAIESAVIGGEGLQLTVHGAVERIHQRAVLVARKQFIPVRTPQQLDDIPAGAGKQRFQLIDDAAVAAYRSVQALQIAVDHKDQVIQFFARRQTQCRQRFRLIHLAIAKHAPHLASLILQQTAMLQIA